MDQLNMKKVDAVESPLYHLDYAPYKELKPDCVELVNSKLFR